jgi:hypothetical protein
MSPFLATLLALFLLGAMAGFTLVKNSHARTLMVMLSLNGIAAALFLSAAFGPGQLSARQFNALFWSIGSVATAVGLGVGNGFGFMYRKNGRKTS